LENTLQNISQTNNSNVSLMDLKEFISRNKKNFNRNFNIDKAYSENFKKISIKSPIKIKDGKENKEFYENIFEKLGIFIFENYGELQSFFNENSKNGKMFLENLQNFIKKNLYAEKLNNINISPDDIVNLFSLMDTEKNNFLKFENIENKLQKFDFYEKMHLEITNFLLSNFKDGIGAFKYFKQKHKNENENNNLTNYHNFNSITYEKLDLSKKEMLDGINFLFPRKYLPQTLTNYLRKKFKNSDEISFSEFNYLYFDDIKSDSNLRKTINSFKNYKDKTSDIYSINEDNNNKIHSTLLSKTSRNFRSKSLYNTEKYGSGNKILHKLDTPFDEDPLEKIRRIIYASRFDFTNYFKMYDLLTVDGMVNHNQFKNMLKKMNIGITTLEIDQILAKAGMTRHGMVSIRDFMKFLQNE